MSFPTANCDCPPYDCRAVVARYLKGERAAGDDLCRKFQRLTMALVRRIIPERYASDWDDVAQIALLRLTSKLHLWRDEAPLCKFASVVIARVAIDALRQARRPETTADLDQVTAADDHDPNRLKRQVNEALRLVERLGPQYRQLLELQLAGFTNEHIAQQLGVTRKTVYNRSQKIILYLAPFREALEQID